MTVQELFIGGWIMAARKYPASGVSAVGVNDTVTDENEVMVIEISGGAERYTIFPLADIAVLK